MLALTIRGSPIGSICEVRDGVDNHDSSGVFNRAYYELALRLRVEVWDAFEMFYYANTRYWTSQTGMLDGAALVLKCAQHMKEGRMSKWDWS